MLYGERAMEAISATKKHIELHVFELQARRRQEGETVVEPALRASLSVVLGGPRPCNNAGEHDRRLRVGDGGAGSRVCRCVGASSLRGLAGRGPDRLLRTGAACGSIHPIRSVFAFPRPGRVYVGDVEPDPALLVKSAIAQVLVQMGVDLARSSGDTRHRLSCFAFRRPLKVAYARRASACCSLRARLPPP